MARFEEISSRDFEHEQGPKGCSCGMQGGNWMDYRNHIQLLQGLAETPKRLLVGQAISPTGRSQWTVWLDHVGYRADTPYGFPDRFRKLREAWREEKVARARAIIGSGSWKIIDYYDMFYPWITAINKTMGQDLVWRYDNQYMAYAQGLIAIGKQDQKGWACRLFDEMGGEAPTPTMTPLNNIASLIGRANKAQGTEQRVKRIREIDEVLAQMEVLRDVREGLYDKVTLG